MENPTPLSIVKSRRKPLRNVNIIHNESLTPLERFAVWITDHIGTMGFFLIIFFWTVIWLSWNMFAPVMFRFDAYPAFVLWLFISNMIQLFLLPLVMVGQNLQSRHAEARAEADFDINTKSEQEIEVILEHLEYQNDLMLKILRHIDNKN